MGGGKNKAFADIVVIGLSAAIHIIDHHLKDYWIKGHLQGHFDGSLKTENWLDCRIARGHHSYARFCNVHASDHLFCQIVQINAMQICNTQIVCILPLSVVKSH